MIRFALCGLILLILACSNPHDPASVQPTQPISRLSGTPIPLNPAFQATAHGQELERSIHRRINQIRAGENLATLEFRADVAAVARAHSFDMLARNYGGHISPEGLNPRQRLEAAHVPACEAVGENIGKVSRPGAGAEALAGIAVEAWYFSPPHRENILGARWHSAGIGSAQGALGQVVLTHVFCGG